MPLFDKVKAQATQLAQKAQEAGKVGQAKIEEAQARRRADGLLRSLGAACYAERTGRGSSEVTAKIDELISSLKTHEAENGPISPNDSVEEDDETKGESV